MSHVLLSDGVPLGLVELSLLPFPDAIKYAKRPRILIGELEPFAAYEHVRSTVRAQSVMPKDFAAPWNTSAEEAALERELDLAIARRPELPPLELRDASNVRLTVLEIRLYEHDAEYASVIRVSVTLSDDDGPGATARLR